MTQAPAKPKKRGAHKDSASGNGALFACNDCGWRDRAARYFNEHVQCLRCGSLSVSRGAFPAAAEPSLSDDSRSWYMAGEMGYVRNDGRNDDS